MHFERKSLDAVPNLYLNETFNGYGISVFTSDCTDSSNEKERRCSNGIETGDSDKMST